MAEVRIEIAEHDGIPCFLLEGGERSADLLPYFFVGMTVKLIRDGKEVDSARAVSVGTHGPIASFIGFTTIFPDGEQFAGRAGEEGRLWADDFELGDVLLVETGRSGQGAPLFADQVTLGKDRFEKEDSFFRYLFRKRDAKRAEQEGAAAE